MKKVVVFMDYANVNASSHQMGCELNHQGLLGYLADEAEGRTLQAAFAFVPVDPRQEHAVDATIDELWHAGYVVNSKVGTIAGDTYKCDFDVEISMAAVQASYDMRPDIVVLISGDSDFAPLVLQLRKRGIRVEAASFDCAMSRLLAKVSSGYIKLDALLEADEDDSAPCEGEREEGTPLERVEATNEGNEEESRDSLEISLPIA